MIKDKQVKFLYLNQKEVIQCGALDMFMVMGQIENFFSLHDNGETIIPDKVTLRWGDASSEAVTGRINAMPGFVGGEINTAGIKWIGSKPLNPTKYGLPRASALTILNDPETGLPIAIMDGTIISAMRTGAVTGVATKYLARKNSEKAAFIGAGTQNHTQLQAIMTAVPSLKEIVICDLSEDRLKNFVNLEKTRWPELSIKYTTSAEEAVRDSDIVVTATTTLNPIVKANWIKNGAFLANVGNYEFEFDTIRKANKIIVDDWDALVHRGIQTPAIMAKEGLLSREDIYAELGAIVNRKKEARQSDEEIIYFCAVGNGGEDVAVAKKIYDRALEKGLGTYLILWDEPFWI